jgi:DNA-binding MarR family transcriptional regulator
MIQGLTSTPSTIVSHYMTASTDPADPSLASLLHQAFQYTKSCLDAALRPHNVSSAQYRILVRLSEYPGSSGAELARTTSYSPQAIQQMFAGLEQMRLVVRGADPENRRILRATLTNKGWRVLVKCKPAVEQSIQDIDRSLGEQDKELLVDLLKRYLGISDISAD